MLKILLVDDEPNVRALMARMLRREGHHVIEAATAFDAINATLGNTTIDLLVTDVLLLPGPSGIVLASVLRQRFPGLPVLLVSGMTAQGSVEGHGPVEFLHKPFAAADLRAAVARLCATDGPPSPDHGWHTLHR